MSLLRRANVALLLAAVSLLAVSATVLAAAPAQAAGKSNLGWLLAGLIVVWAGFFAYTFYVSRRTRDMQRELDELRERLGKRE